MIILGLPYDFALGPPFGRSITFHMYIYLSVICNITEHFLLESKNISYLQKHIKNEIYLGIVRSFGQQPKSFLRITTVVMSQWTKKKKQYNTAEHQSITLKIGKISITTYL